MNVKFSLVVGTAIVCAAMTGCKAPKANVSGGSSVRPTPPPAKQTAVDVDDGDSKSAPKTTVAPAVKPDPARCKCAPGTTHDAPCKCGAVDCGCKVVAPEPEYTLYRVKGGDTLSAICVTYGLKQKQVLELNPGLSPNKLYAGRKIKLPGVLELKEDSAKPVAKPAAAKSTAKKGAAPSRASSYKGATKTYEVKSGDTLGKIAIDNGITVKCLKEMNGLNKNFIRIGQKLKVPAEKPTVAKKAEKAEAAKPAAGNAAAAAAPVAKDKPAENVEVKPAAETKPAEAPAATETQPEEEPQAAENAAAPVNPEPVAAPATSPRTHVVKDGEDALSIAIQYQVSPSAVLDINNLKSTDALTPGQVLKLPDSAKVQ